MSAKTNRKRPVTVAQLLRRAKAIIRRPDRWIKGNTAETRGGLPVSPEDEHAYKFCSWGAIRRARVDLGGADSETYFAAEKCLDKSAGRNFIDFNEAGRTTHRGVIGMFTRAIRFASKRKSAK